MSTQPARQFTASRLFGALCAVLVAAGLATRNDYLFGAGVVVLLVPLFLMFRDMARASAEKAAERQRIWTQGAPAQARVVKLRPTGSRINHDPQVELDLEVLAPGQEPYQVQLITLVSLVALPRVQPECQLDVRFDPADPKRVAIDPALLP